MSWLKTIVAELFGLVVDDGLFAASILVWLALAWLGLPWLRMVGVWGGVLLFVGLAAILIESVQRRARQL